MRVRAGWTVGAVLVPAVLTGGSPTWITGTSSVLAKLAAPGFTPEGRVPGLQGPEQ